MYDPYWRSQPTVIVLYFTISVDPTLMSGYQMLFVLFVLLYGTRLTLNFYRGWGGLQHEDWRYVNFRKQFPKSYWLVSLGGIHLFPTLMVFLGCLPFIGVFSTPYPVMPWLAVTGLIVLLGSVLLAFVADEQLRKFRKVNKDGMIRTGLWNYSRHPNYLGEILTWWGIFLVGLSFGFEFLWTGIGALTITIMFAGVSIPLMEKHLAKRRSWYADYKKNVPSILPIRINK
jgi:steroid 5-alpha reductase family enzyme